MIDIMYNISITANKLMVNNMIKVDLITGFLGSGKTTFIKRYAKFLNDQGLKICIIENDYGAVNVDVALLEDIRSDMCQVEMIVGGDGSDAHKRRLKTKLITLAISGFQRVIIEPSGIFDMDEFFDTLYESPLDNWYEIGSVIAIAPADLEDNLSVDSDYVLASEIADAGVVVLSKTETASRAQISKVKEHIRTALLGISTKRKDIFSSKEAFDNFFINKTYEEFDDDDFKKIASSGYVHGDYEKRSSSLDDAYTSLYLFGVTLSKDKLIENINMAIKDPECGYIIRIKGFAKEKEEYIEINATREKITHAYVKNAQEVIIVIGENLNKEKINDYFPTADFDELI